MHAVRADTERNCLFITLREVIDKAEAETVLSEVVHEVAKLTPGFSVINDISGARLGHTEAAEVVRSGMDFLRARGAKKVVRVVGRAKVILAQFVKLTDGFKGYRPVYVGSMAEAEKAVFGRQ